MWKSPSANVDKRECYNKLFYWPERASEFSLLFPGLQVEEQTFLSWPVPLGSGVYLFMTELARRTYSKEYFAK